MIEVLQEEKAKCCGCNACATACPKNCIVMTEDEEGFKYPVVDKEKCVECGLCEKVCPILQKKNYYREEASATPKAFGGWHKDERVRHDSSSGGAFTLLAEYILEQGGVVYGCELKDDFSAVHIGITSREELYKLRGSKYVQSDTGVVYGEIQEHLQKKRKVLFVGTPCQCAGLHSFLGREYEDLYICDFICHGVPSPKVFKSYINYLEEKNKDKVIGFRFRNKDKGWSATGMQMGTLAQFQNSGSKRFAPAFRDSYMNGFLDDLYLRPSCYACEFKCLPKYYVDFTIADFWGVNKVCPELNQDEGTSLVLIHRKHGEALFEKIKDNFFYKEVDFLASIRRNYSLIKSVPQNSHREDFFYVYNNEAFEKVVKKYMSAFRWASHKAIKIGWSYFEKIIRVVVSPILRLFHQNWDEIKWNAFMQFIKFSIVGISNSLVSYLINISILLLLKDAGLRYDYMIANVTAFVLSVLWSFYWNNSFVFESKTKGKRKRFEALLKTYISYAFTGIILNNVLAVLWIEILKISKYISPLLNLPITVPINFLMQKLWVYKEKNIRIS